MSKSAWYPSFVPVIPVQSLSHLENYKFTSAQQGCIDNFLSKYWWAKIANLVPSYVHPNLITLIGAFFMTTAFSLAIATITGLIKKNVSCIFFTIAFCILIYQTFDGIDGIVSRKQGVSSPLGQFLDHGFDSIYTILWPLLTLLLFDLQFNLCFYILSFLSFIQLTVIMFKEQDKGVFYSHNTCFGVTEVQFFTMILMIINGWFGTAWFTTPFKYNKIGKVLFGTFLGKFIPANWKVSNFIMFIIIFGCVFTLLFDIIITFRATKQKIILAKVLSSNAFHYLIIFSVHCFKPLGKGSFFSAPTLPHNLNIIMHAFTILTLLTIVLSNLISVICKIPMRCTFLHMVPNYLFLFLYYIKYAAKITLPKIDGFFTTHDKLTLLFSGFAVLGALFIIHHFICVVCEMEHHLGISLFVVKPRVANSKRF